jgi:hypothetical protein
MADFEEQASVMEDEQEDDHASMGEEEQECHENRLSCVQNNESNEFCFGDDSDQPFELQWTIEQWNKLFTELSLRNTSVDAIIAGIHVCPVEALSSFEGYIRTTKNIKRLTIQFDESAPVIPENYRTKIDDILGAVRGNPAIKKLTLRCLGNPQSIKNLLTGNASLETFTLQLPEHHPHLSKKSTKGIAAGLRGNKQLKEIGIFVHQGRLDVICSGLCHREDDSLSCLESLSLWTDQPWNNPNLGPVVLEAIKCCRSLKTLSVQKPDFSWYTMFSATFQPWLDYVLKNLHHPECSNLETIRLEHLALGSTDHDELDGDTDDSRGGGRGPADWIVPYEQSNTTVEEVTLEIVSFLNESTARLLLNLRGVRRLHVRKLSYLSSANNGIEENGENDSDEMMDMAERVEDVERSEQVPDDESDRIAAEEANIDYWAQLIRQFTDLRSAHFELDDDMDIDDRARILESVLKGTRGHAALEELTLRFDGVQMQGAGRLRLLLQSLLHDTTCLRELQLHDIRPNEDLAVGLSVGLRANKLLEKLAFRMRYTAAGDGANYIRILDSVWENDTLQNLSDETFYDMRARWVLGRYGGPYPADDNQAICEALARVFQRNKSLIHISLPALDLRGSGQIRGLLEGLGRSSTLKSIDMSNCETDTTGYGLLGQALVDNTTIPVERIVLPCLSPEHSSGALATDLEDFFLRLVHMRRIKTVDFDNSSWPLTDDDDRVNCLNLMLNAAKENKYIQSFGRDLDEFEENDSCIQLMSDIKYHLKLNRFGRHGLDSKNLRRNLWPVILAPMTVKSKDADALFFFIREYFMRNSYPHRQRHEQQQSQQRPPTQQQLPSPKRARLDRDNSGKKRS